MSDPKKFKEKIILLLNENPDFFNDYPELVKKIRSPTKEGFPLESPNLLSVFDQIQLVRNDREHIKNKLECFIDLARNNENIYDHLSEIEHLALNSTELLPMISQLRAEIIKRFDIEHVIVYLADRTGPFIEKKLKTRYPETIDGTLRFVEQPILKAWFSGKIHPILRGNVDIDSKVFTSQRLKYLVKSEALLPIIIRDTLVGCVALGCEKPDHFHQELSAGFITRMVTKLGISIDNIMLMEELKQQSFIDPLTEHFNRFYLLPVLIREFDRAKRSKKNLSSIMMSIDYLDHLFHTDDELSYNAVLQEVGNILSSCCRGMDVIIRYDETEFFILLPESSSREAMEISNLIRKTIEGTIFPVSASDGRLTASLGLAIYPSIVVNSHQELLQVSFKNFSKAKAKGGNRVVLA